MRDEEASLDTFLICASPSAHINAAVSRRDRTIVEGAARTWGKLKRTWIEEVKEEKKSFGDF